MYFAHRKCMSSRSQRYRQMLIKSNSVAVSTFTNETVYPLRMLIKQSLFTCTGLEPVVSETGNIIESGSYGKCRSASL